MRNDWPKFARSGEFELPFLLRLRPSVGALLARQGGVQDLSRDGTLVACSQRIDIIFAVIVAVQHCSALVMRLAVFAFCLRAASASFEAFWMQESCINSF